MELPQEHRTREEVMSFLEAIRLDCEAGTLAQASEFHDLEPVMEYERDGYTERPWSFWVRLDMADYDIYLDIWSDATHTLEWIRSRGIDQKIVESYS